ncbi:MAG: hypothetical protein HYR90_00185 [Candidatus Andersenbacteria bacterium]|nr:hypothetical protein [Candidatus Andersenbacteria bacterium]MBI3250658.1 hypothetical protein [Candidatus Andersenbacteria bacterium]
MSSSSTTTDQYAIKALLELSGIPSQKFYDRMVKIIAKAPDPETVCQVFADEFQISGILQEKWRKVITQTWHSQHEHASYPLEIPLTSQEVLDAPALRDALGLLDELAAHPADLVKQEGETIFAAHELPRLTAALPSLRGYFIETPEHEWGCPRLSRLRLVLNTLKLTRVYQGKLTVVKSRHERFDDLPYPQRFYVLWHADVYHVRWGGFASAWSQYLDVVQEYLPLIWDLARGTRAGQVQTTTDISFALLDGYQGLWEQSGLLSGEDGPQTLLDLYHESALPVVMEQLLIRDVLARYGLIEAAEGLPALVRGGMGGFSGPASVVRWTNIGETLLSLERSGDLPCGMELIT